MSADDSVNPAKAASYTIGDLERETGFDRRTIAYYVQEELLPRVGRRGPRTRYPRLVRDRLLFIRRVRDAEEAGTVSPVSLKDFRRIFDRVSPSLIAGVANERIAVTADLVQEASTAFRLPDLRRAGVRLPETRRAALSRRVEPRVTEPGRPRFYASAAREGPEEPLLQAPAAPPADLEAERPGRTTEALLADSLSRLQRRARRRRKRKEGGVDTWTRVRITREIALSVRGLDEDDRKLVERVRKALRRLIRQG